MKHHIKSQYPKIILSIDAKPVIFASQKHNYLHNNDAGERVFSKIAHKHPNSTFGMFLYTTPTLITTPVHYNYPYSLLTTDRKGQYGYVSPNLVKSFSDILSPDTDWSDLI